MRTLNAIAAALIAALMAGPAPAQDNHDHKDHGDHDESLESGSQAGHDEEGHGAVRLTPAELEEFDIRIATAGPGTIDEYVALAGEVRPNADRLAHIVPRYSGIVHEVRGSIGDKVTKGEVLAIIESDESLSPYSVKTLIPGTIIAKHIALGEAVSREDDAFVIADLSTVWIDLAVYQRDIPRIRIGQKATVFIGHDVSNSDATISYVTPIVDEVTRTATARIELPNRDGRWRPGMFVNCRVLVSRVDAAVVVPETAVHTFEDDTVVFVETARGFEPHPIATGRTDGASIEVLSGLEPGVRFVSHGGFTIKAELGKSSFGDGHGH